MRSFAKERTSALLARLAFEIARVRKRADADAVHDLRVAMRRLLQCLRLMPQFLPNKPSEKLRRRLRRLMRLTAAVRDRDIALKQIENAGLSSSSALSKILIAERKQARQQAREAARRLSGRGFLSKWRRRLEL